MITKKELAYARRQLKPLKIKTIFGKNIEIEIETKPHLARILEVSRQAVYDAIKRTTK